MQRAPLPPPVTVLAIASPLSAIAIGIGWAWPWWVTLTIAAAAVAVVAEVAGIHSGVLSAMLATAGMALAVERAHPHDLPRNGVELVVMVVLLLVALVFGVDRPIG